MWNYIKSVNLIRYLIFWRVNSSLVRLPRSLSSEISAVLGSIIAKRLPSNESRRWQKALEPWDRYFKGDNNTEKNIPQTSWPIDSVLLTYPAKRTYGRDEIIIWELKLFGKSADHELFLENILPAMEEAGYTSDNQWNRQNRLWGHFDIHSVYVAHGKNWQPLVTNSVLDLKYRPSSVQWYDELSLDTNWEARFHTPTQLLWVTPFNLSDFFENKDKRKSQKTPNLEVILKAFENRFKSLIPEIKESLISQELLEELKKVSINNISLSRPKNWSECLIGTQLFSYIPSAAIPYLELASIFHIGKQIHYGFGTFTLMKSTKGS
ncbi:hypothetical protein FJZ33_09505 [Candidatus Poribacteria bacterium]|nr:hypothetical protein [Candidatus Poribacteria bacterium]